MTEDNKSRRAAIIAKVRALLAKTTENGCTEDEAIAAAQMADKLMREYDLAHGDIETEVRSERYGARRRKFAGSSRTRTPHEVRYCLTAVGEYFDCKYWREGPEIIFFGSETDSELAHAFADMLRIAMDQQWSSYLNSRQRDHGAHGRTLRQSFMAGMVNRLCERLRQLKRDRSAPATGNALMVVKGAVTTERFNKYAREHRLNIRSGSRSYVRHAGAFGAGQAAGSRVDLGGGKIGSGSSARIGR